MASAQQGRRVLVAGIGNIFLGDDGFGVEVVSRLDKAALPPSAELADYGIRGVHLAYDLLDGRCDTLIMVDAAPVGGPPGTLAVLHVSDRPGGSTPAPATVDGHAMTPQAVLDVLAHLGGTVGRVLVVGCQPAVIAERIGLSEPVRQAVNRAARLVASLAWEEAGAAGPAGGVTQASPAEGARANA